MIIFKGTNLHIIFGFVAPDRKEKITKILQTISNQGVFVKGVIFLKKNSTVIFITIKKEELQTKEFKTVSQLPTRIELPNISFIHTQ